MNTEEAYANGYDCGFRAGYLAGVQDKMKKLQDIVIITWIFFLAIVSLKFYTKEVRTLPQGQAQLGAKL